MFGLIGARMQIWEPKTDAFNAFFQIYNNIVPIKPKQYRGQRGTKLASNEGKLLFAGLNKILKNIFN